jgi:MFS family permease
MHMTRPILFRLASRSSAFGKLWTASTVSNLGDGVWLVAAPLLAATLTQDPARIAGLAVAQRAPWLLFGLLGGALADRFDRRRTMIAVALVRGLLVATLAVALLLGRTTLVQLYAVFFLIAIGETLFDTAAVAIIPSLVPRDQLARANARMAGVWTVTNQFVGPPLGGALFALAAPAPFLVGAIGLAGSTLIVAAIHGSFAPARDDAAATSRTSLRVEIAEGVRWLWGDRLLRTLAIVLAALNVAVAAQAAIMVLVAEQRLGLSPGGYGLLLTAYGVGGVIGSLSAERILTRIGDAACLRLALLVEAAAPAVIALTHSPWIVGLALAGFGVHATVRGALTTTLQQGLTPDRLRGRVGSVTMLLEYGTAAPGALIGGWLAARYGLTAPFWLGVAVGLAMIPFAWPVFADASLRRARTPAD